MCWRNPGFIREYDGCMHKTDCCQQGYCQEWQPLRNSEYSILIRGGWWDGRRVQSSDKWRKRLECFHYIFKIFNYWGLFRETKTPEVRSWYNSIIFSPLRSQKSSEREDIVTLLTWWISVRTVLVSAGSGRGFLYFTPDLEQEASLGQQ